MFRNGKPSKAMARSRLHFVLVQDRTGLTPEEMSSFKREMVDVIQRYFVIDEQGFDIAYKRDSDSTTLVINSPVVVRRQESPGYRVGARHDRERGKVHKELKTEESNKGEESAVDTAKAVVS